MREATNRARVEGLLLENDLKYDNREIKGVATESINGTIKVLVEQEINGENSQLEVPIHIWVNRFNKSGELSRAYESMERVMKEFVSIAASGSKQNATKIRIDGNISMNEFYRNDGTLSAYPRVRTFFVNEAYGAFEPKATFELEFFVTDIARVVDADGVEANPAKLEVSVISPGYGDAVEVLKLIAVSPSVINAVESYWEVGSSYKASGRMDFSSTTVNKVTEVDFGEPIVEMRTIKTSDLIITGGSQTPLDEESAFPVEEIKERMAKRKARLEERRDNPKPSTAPVPADKSTKGKLDLGF